MLPAGCHSGMFGGRRHDHALLEPTDQQSGNDVEHPSTTIELDGTQRSMVEVACPTNTSGNKLFEFSDTGYTGSVLDI